MRMWSVNPRVLCNQHLLGEHNEMHMFAGCLRKGVSVQGYVDKGLVHVSQIRSRHEELVAEMIRRGMRHKSPLPDFLTPIGQTNLVSVEANLVELRERCEICKMLQETGGWIK